MLNERRFLLAKTVVALAFLWWERKAADFFNEGGVLTPSKERGHVL